MNGKQSFYNQLDQLITKAKFFIPEGKGIEFFKPEEHHLLPLEIYIDYVVNEKADIEIFFHFFHIEIDVYRYLEEQLFELQDKEKIKELIGLINIKTELVFKKWFKFIQVIKPDPFFTSEELYKKIKFGKASETEKVLKAIYKIDLTINDFYTALNKFQYDYKLELSFHQKLEAFADKALKRSFTLSQHPLNSTPTPSKNQYNPIEKGVYQKITLESLFYNPALIDPAIDILKQTDPPLINSHNAFLGKQNKTAFKIWLDALALHHIIKPLPNDKDLATLLTNSFTGLTLAKDGSTLRTNGTRAAEIYTYQIKAMAAKLSHISQSGK